MIFHLLQDMGRSYVGQATYTTVNKSHIWIALHENLEGSCSTGTDGIQVDVVKWSFLLVPDMCRYRFSESIGCIDGIPGGND